jgi:putative ABC transport system permease protein
VPIVPRLLPGRTTPGRVPPLAWNNVREGGRRSLAAMSGIGFALVMVLLQLGFLEAVKVTAATNYDQLDFDLVLLSPRYEQFYDPGDFPRERLQLARGQSGVASVRPLWSAMNVWRCPPYPLDRPPTVEQASRVTALDRWWLGTRYPRPLQRRELLVLGVDLSEAPFRDPIAGEVAAQREALGLDGRVLFNVRSNPDFGGSLIGQVDTWELGMRRVEVAGTFQLPRSFGADAAVLCGEATFAQAFGMPSTRLPRVNFGLVRLEPGASVSVLPALRARMPADVRVLTRAEVHAIESDYWVRQTATGRIFAFGVFVAMLVAAIVIYQVLSNDIRKRLPEYATLKAMGHTDTYLARVVLAQGLLYALVAFVPAVAIAAGAYHVTRDLANIPMVLTWENLAWTLLLTVVFSVVTGLLTARKLRAANPADLY